jgi:hypothetical protein
MTKLRLILPPSLALLLACSSMAFTAHAQPASTASPDSGNKAGKPPTDAAASRAGVATKKPSKPGAQSGPPAASTPDSSSGNKAAKPPTDEAASRSGVATKKPAKPGAQSGPKAPAPN